MVKDNYIIEIPIADYDDLVKIIQGKTDYCKDLRDKFIFRGVEDEAFELTPSALRKENKLNNYVDEDFKLTLALPYEKAVESGFVDKKDYYEDVDHFTVNKYGQLIDEDINDYAGVGKNFNA